MKKHPAFFTYDPRANAYYFAPTDAVRGPGCVDHCLNATVVIDVAKDGTMLGIELLDIDMLDHADLPLPPKPKRRKKK